MLPEGLVRVTAFEIWPSLLELSTDGRDLGNIERIVGIAPVGSLAAALRCPETVDGPVARDVGRNDALIRPHLVAAHGRRPSLDEQEVVPMVGRFARRYEHSGDRLDGKNDKRHEC